MCLRVRACYRGTVIAPPALVYICIKQNVSATMAHQSKGFALFLMYMLLSKAQDGGMWKVGERSKSVRDHTRMQAGLKRAKGGGGEMGRREKVHQLD